MEYQRSLSPKDKKLISFLSIKSKKDSDGLMTGIHSSKHHGASVEFEEHKVYVAGDNIKAIDWKLLGKSDKYYIKRYQNETDMKSMIILDSSASMDYASSNRSKFDTASRIALAWATIMIRQGDRVGLFVPSNKKSKQILIPPTSSSSVLSLMEQELARFNCFGKISIKDIVSQFMNYFSGVNQFLFVSDLFYEEIELFKSIKSLQSNCTDTFVFQILDEFEISFPFNRRHNFLDMESNSSLSLEPISIASDYRKIMKDFLETSAKHFISDGIEYLLFKGEDSSIYNLSTFLNKRNSL